MTFRFFPPSHRSRLLPACLAVAVAWPAAAAFAQATYTLNGSTGTNTLSTSIATGTGATLNLGFAVASRPRTAPAMIPAMHAACVLPPLRLAARLRLRRP